MFENENEFSKTLVYTNFVTFLSRLQVRLRPPPPKLNVELAPGALQAVTTGSGGLAGRGGAGRGADRCAAGALWTARDKCTGLRAPGDNGRKPASF